MNVTCLGILLSAFSFVQSKLCRESVTYMRFVVLLVLTCGWRGLVLTGLSVVFKGYSLCLLVFQLTLILMSVVFASWLVRTVRSFVKNGICSDVPPTRLNSINSYKDQHHLQLWRSDYLRLKSGSSFGSTLTPATPLRHALPNSLSLCWSNLFSFLTTASSQMSCFLYTFYIFLVYGLIIIGSVP